MDVAVVQNWLTTMKTEPRLEQPVEGVGWWVNFNYPRGASQVMRVQTFDEWPKAVFVASTGQMPPHVAPIFGSLSEADKVTFSLDLQAVLLNAAGVLFQLEPASPSLLSLPTHVHVMSLRYETSLSMDSLHRSILDVYKAEQLWQNFVMKRVGFPPRRGES
jgi:hypothetical protein